MLTDRWSKPLATTDVDEAGGRPAEVGSGAFRSLSRKDEQMESKKNDHDQSDAGSRSDDAAVSASARAVKPWREAPFVLPADFPKDRIPPVLPGFVPLMLPPGTRWRT